MERSFWSTIGGKLLSRTLAVVLIPVLTIGGVAIASMQSLSGAADEYMTAARSALSDDVVGSQVADVSEQIARQIAIFLDERVADIQGLSTDVGLVTAANAAGGRAAVRGLPDVPTEELEAQFAGNPRLSDVHAERDLVNVIATTPAFKEISLTDVNGFNVDYSSPPSDFVQSDEDWWISAMANGLDISAPEFDTTTGIFAMNIAIRLDREGRPVGVLKAALDIQVIQTIADQFAGGAESFGVTIVDSAGLFLAETSSGHEASHIMNPIYLASSLATTSEFVLEVFETNSDELHPDGFSISDEGVGGFAHITDELDALRGEMQSEVSAFAWTVVVEQPSEVAFASLAPLEGLAGQVSSTSLKLSILLILVAGVGALAAGYVATLFGRRLTSPIALLRDAAVKTAEVTLPNVVAQIDTLEPDEELPELERITLDTGDEVEDLAESFNTVQQTAVDLASGQARMRRKNVATTFVNLGRRNQNLLSRQLEHINSMEDNETNSATLHRLFQLDHLATRMRRNAESLLVLAGEETPRRFRRPVTIHQLVQAAGGEIEDFDRVEITTLDDASLEGGAASDIAHLLAELLENASSYSPPGVPIQVHGRRRQNGYALSIVDQGIGMEEEDIASANARLADPAEFDRAPSAYLGHFVVGHLAKRHGIRVQLTDSPYAGVAAQIHLPSAILASPDEVDQARAIGEVRTSDIYSEADAELTESERTQIEAIELALFADAPAVVGSHVEPATSEQPPAPVFADVSVVEELLPVVTAIPGDAVLVEHVATPVPTDTTPSGFRRRRRGEEGAPRPVAPSNDHQPAPARRSPEEVQESLKRFRMGVEAGRAQSAENNRQDDQQFSGGDTQ
jgi:signal transduction histidine kinase